MSPTKLQRRALDHDCQECIQDAHRGYGALPKACQKKLRPESLPMHLEGCVWSQLLRFLQAMTELNQLHNGR